eukprot:3209908-Amphidinium_carterae.1
MERCGSGAFVKVGKDEFPEHLKTRSSLFRVTPDFPVPPNSQIIKNGTKNRSNNGSNNRPFQEILVPKLDV